MCEGRRPSSVMSPRRRRGRPSPPSSPAPPPPPSPPPHLVRDANILFTCFYMIIAGSILLASMPMATPRPLPRQYSMQECIDYRVYQLDEPYSDASAQ